jgi:DNA-binding LacI/PurR family transcriptional regulator
MENRMITISDVAKAARVSETTVSAVMGRSERGSNVRVGLETRERVLAAAKELGYSTNILASGLRKGKTRTIGLVLEYLGGEVTMIKAQMIEDLARENGYRVFTCCHHDKAELEEADVCDLMARRVDGLIIFPIFRAAEDKSTHLQRLAEKNFPMVTFYGELPFPVNSVKVDNVHGGLLGVRHMAEIGRRKMAFIGGNPVYHSVRDRISGWREGCREAGFNFGDMPFIENTMTIAEEKMGYQLCRNLMDSGKGFDALIASNDYLALGGLKALQDRGVRVPEEVAVIGFDDNRFSAFLSVPLTTIQQPAKEVGETAFRLLLNKIENPDSPPEQVILKPNLVVRQSTTTVKTT